MTFVTSSSGLLLPGADLSPCEICGDRMPANQVTNHKISCSKKHRDELYEEGLKRQRDVFQHDDEKYDWMRRRVHGST